jgi:hypothetical protein
MVEILLAFVLGFLADVLVLSTTNWLTQRSYYTWSNINFWAPLSIGLPLSVVISSFLFYHFLSRRSSGPRWILAPVFILAGTLGSLAATLFMAYRNYWDPFGGRWL